jgi:hypothetical protein
MKTLLAGPRGGKRWALGFGRHSVPACSIGKTHRQHRLGRVLPSRRPVLLETSLRMEALRRDVGVAGCYSSAFTVVTRRWFGGAANPASGLLGCVAAESPTGDLPPSHAGVVRCCVAWFFYPAKRPLVGNAHRWS